MGVCIRTIGSSSRGNSYIIDADGSKLIIELGVGFDKIMESLNYNVSLVAGCLVSHRIRHNDHLNPTTAKKITRLGLNIYGNRDVAYAANGIALQPKKNYKIGAFTVNGFPLQHRAENFGYIITCPDGTRILFATDAKCIPYRFKNINVYMIEANHDDETVIENMAKEEPMYNRFDDHMGIEDCIAFLDQSFPLGSCRYILLIHPSSLNARPSEYIRQIKERYGIECVDVAQAGMVVDVTENF